MPVTAKLSRKFYERFGDEIAGELVDWFNAVDSTYQTQLRETNDLNWERFKAELRAQGVEIRAEIQTEVAKVRAELQAEISALRSEMQIGFAQLREEMAKLESRLMKWMFIYWSGMMATQAALLWAILSHNR